MSPVALFNSFFFSCRRRHTRYWRDWSSDVCSSDLKEIPIGTFSISKIGFSKGLPVSGQVSYAGLKLSKALIPDPRAKEAFEKLGLDTLTLSLGGSYQWDLEKKQITVRDIALKVDELGAINLSADLADVAPGPDWQAHGSLAHAV